MTHDEDRGHDTCRSDAGDVRPVAGLGAQSDGLRETRGRALLAAPVLSLYWKKKFDRDAGPEDVEIVPIEVTERLAGRMRTKRWPGSTDVVTHAYNAQSQRISGSTLGTSLRVPSS